MGHVAYGQLDSAYGRIKLNASRNGGTGASTVLIFVSPDPDALCALKILVTLLKSDCIAHKIVPVAGFNDLTTGNEDHVENNEELRSIVLLNCGGNLDLLEIFDLTEEMSVYVCDSHRPLNLRNVFGQEQIIFLDDGDIDELPDLKQAVEELEFEDSDEEDEDEPEDDIENDPPDDDRESGGDESESDGEGGRRPTAKRKRRPEDTISDPHSTKRARITARRKRRREHQRLLSEYFSEGAYYGMAVTGMMYLLATQLGRASNAFLWLALIGLSDQYVHDRVNQSRYLSLVESYTDEVTRFNIPSGPVAGAAELDDFEAMFGDSLNPRALNDASRHPDNEAIRCDDEFRLMLLRHWTMLEALHYSVYVGAKLGMWKEKGRQRLTTFLVKMGLPYKESQQRYTEMSLPFKRSIKEKLISVSPRFNMPEIVFPSFYKHYGYKGIVSAPDVVYSLTSLLDWGAEWISRHGTSGYGDSSGANARQLGPQGARQGRDMSEVITGALAGVGVGTRTGMAAIAMRSGDAIPSLSDEEDEADKEDEDEDVANQTRERRKQERAWVRNFYVAYDALDAFDILQHGIHLAMNFQRSLVRTGVSILEKKLTQTLSAFSLTVLTGEGLSSGVSGSGALSDDNDFALFGRSPAHLNRLAKFLLEAFKEFHKKELPLVLAALNPAADKFLVVGYTGLSKKGVVRKNTFGPAFQAAAEECRVVCKHDSFESAVMEVPRETLEEFLGSLQTLMMTDM